MSDFQKGMKPRRHIRASSENGLALCGVGTEWYGTTSFEKPDQPATCTECLDLRASVGEE